MKLTLTLQEKTDLLTTALQYFAESLRVWEYDYYHNSLEYQKARIRVSKKIKGICQENVFCSIVLHGKGMTITDINDSEESILFNRERFDKNLGKCDPTEVLKLLSNDGDYDFYTTDSVLQCLIFGEVTFG